MENICCCVCIQYKDQLVWYDPRGTIVQPAYYWKELTEILEKSSNNKMNKFKFIPPPRGKGCHVNETLSKNYKRFPFMSDFGKQRSSGASS